MNAAPDQSCTIAPPGAGNVPRGAASDARASGGGATRGSRAAPLLAFALLLLPLLGAPGLTPDRGQALAAPVIAANGGQPVSTSHFTLNDRYRAFALKFATGPNAGGYDVHAVAVRLQNASSGIMMEGRIHRLRAYVIREWLVWLPGHPAGSVLTRQSRVDRHRWNRWSADRLWRLREFAELAGSDGSGSGGALDTQLAYSVRAKSPRGLLTPFAGLSLPGAGERVWRMGASWVLSPGVASRTEAERREAPGQAAVFAVTQRLMLRW